MGLAELLADLHKPTPGVTPHVEPAEFDPDLVDVPMPEPERTHTIQRPLGSK